MRLVLPENPGNSQTMAKYMKNHFPFAGVAAPERKKLSQPLRKDSLQWPVATLLAEVQYYYQLPQREYQYVAISLVEANSQRLTRGEMQKFLPLVAQKQWWDSIDSWRKVFADFVVAHPTELSHVFGWFYQQEDFWFRRIAINLQLKFKAKTDLELLTAAILADRKTDEFFIQKAIGWSLREYSKTDPQWVKDFFQHYELSKLAVREGAKYL